MDKIQSHCSTILNMIGNQPYIDKISTIRSLAHGSKRPKDMSVVKANMEKVVSLIEEVKEEI